jgi:predicted ATPase/DNA-binding SARP family transcriptional activator
MRFKVLGPLEVEADHGPIVIVGQRLRALLTALLLQPNDVVVPERLVDAIWGEDPPESAANALQQVVTRLRSRLGDGARHVATAPGGGYRVVVSPGELDAEEFEARCRRAREQIERDAEGALRELESALALWRGPAYGEFAASFAQAPAVRLEELRTAARADHVELLIRTGAAGDAVAAGRELVGSAPLRERPVELLMRALHATGRVADALEVYRRHRELLADELGLDPSAALRDVEARILQDDLPGPARPGPYPVAAEPVGRSALPSRQGDLIGRSDELAIVRDCLESRRLVTLVGPGGVGKTRVALELAHEMRAEGKPVVWVDLSAAEPGRIHDLVAEAIGVEMSRAPDPHAALAASLRTSSSVLCLDNAETVLDDLAPLVEILSEGAPRLRMLATSRERLAVHSEHVHRLAPFPLPTAPDPDNPAIRLFLDRANSLEHPTLADLEDIALLCRRLDGLPLAIELGAAQAPTFGIRQFSDHIAGELDLLAGGRRTAAGRHRTLRAVIDASYAQLTADEAAIFVRLAVFPASFTLEDARTVGADNSITAGAVGAILGRLADQSLVQTDSGRFWLLQTLRTYGLDKLEQGDLVRLRARHARHVTDRVAGLGWQSHPEREESCVAQLAAMSPGLHTAWAYAVAHDRELGVELAALVYDFAYHRQRLDLLDWGRQVAEWDIEHPDLSAALATGAASAWAAGDLELAERLARRGVADDDGTPRPRSARAVSQLANLAMFEAAHDKAIRLYEQCVALSLTEGMPSTALLEEIAICQVMTYAGRRTDALALLGDLNRRARESRSPSAIAWAKFVTAETTGDADVAAALAAYRTAIEESTKVDNRLFLGLARSSAVALGARHGPADEALAEFERVMDQWDEFGNVTGQWWVLMNLSILFARLGADQPAALLAGAIIWAEARTYTLMGDEGRLHDTVRELGARLGAEPLQALLAEGGTLTIEEGVAVARQTISDLGHRREPGDA